MSSGPTRRFGPRSVVPSVLAMAMIGGAASGSSAQLRPTGLEIGALPAVNFDSDEGFGYGALAEFYQYGAGGAEPYLWTLQPTLFFTTEGRRDVELFFDAPHVLPGGWRFTGFVGRNQQIATPFYGVGNQTTFEPALADEDGPNPYFYRFGLLRSSATVDLQSRVADAPLRFLFGVGFERTRVSSVPDGQGTTLFAQSFGAGEISAWHNYVRGGFVWDTRDQETGPTSGAWTEFLVWAVAERLGGDEDFIRWTFTDRRYVTLAEGWVFAHRYLIQNVGDGAPVYELFRVQSSFKQQEGLGGGDSVRGLLRNRYVGRGMLIWNAELRWRALEFRAVGRSFHAVLSAFVDQGRVWADRIDFGELFQDLHRGYGGGVRVGMGENFVVAVDGGTSAETGAQLYIGLGYLY